MSPETLRFLLDLVNGQQVQVGHPAFDETVRLLSAAKREIAEAIEVAASPEA